MVGETVASYRLVSKLGEGGMGVVYLGEHQRIARKAAIKVLLQDFSRNQDVVDRFFREAMATSRIRHPGIVEVLDCNVLPNGSAYIVMELLEGESLGAHLRRHGRLSVQRAVFFTRHVAEALAAAHDEKIAHRDLKPDNIFVLTARPSGPSQPIKVVDFGIAKLLNTGSGQSSTKTRTGSIMGTPVYMSPEQCRGTGEINHRTDIYSLGCILFEMVTGRPPFMHEGFGELIQSHLGVVPPTVRSIDPALPPSVDALVARMLEKAPGDRPLTMRALVADLDGIAAGEPAMTGPVPVVAPSAPRAFAVELPRVKTTLRSASAEKMDALDDEDLAFAKPRRRGVLIAGAIAAVAVAGVGIWKAGSSTSSSGPVAAVTVPPVPIATPKPVEAVAATAVATPPEVKQPVAPPSAPSPPAVTPDQPAPHPAKPAVAPKEKVTRTAAAPTTHKVHVSIATVPSGADVCLASDRVLLGRTAFEWGVDRSEQTVKVLIRKTGYRGQELSVTADGVVKHRIVLDKLGPDDIDDTVTCKPR